MLVSAKHQPETVIGIPIPFPSWTFLPPASPSHPLCSYRTPVWVPWFIRHFPIGYKFYLFIYFPGGTEGKLSSCNAGDLGSIPGLGRSPGGGEWQHTPLFLPGEYPWTEESGGLQSVGSQRVRCDWANKHIYFTKGNVHFHVTLFIYSNHSFLPKPHVHKSVLYVCVSTVTLQIILSVL